MKNVCWLKESEAERGPDYIQGTKAWLKRRYLQYVAPQNIEISNAVLLVFWKQGRYRFFPGLTLFKHQVVTDVMVYFGQAKSRPEWKMQKNKDKGF